MKFPKLVKAYCPKCKTHTDHSISLYKGGKRRELAEGQRRYNRKNLGYGSTRKPVPKRFAKVTKKQTLMFKCQKCGYTYSKPGMRVKKLELVEVIK
ncbi:50S ribosomal protein L44e [Metallosphaera sp. J1]|uniref:50S ribosomal protein L44e n=1 Tax=Metallosphaera TaxID=41980 RepID=UPI001EDE02C1|nr:50S ribosomal protein L44e [Metallosphaera javensis (ex Hofmann et al. 2022)]MCG3108738.1 50S ribosomal protein L44e [Metallosphaera javensis (ex Hofmann et al. 2022)]BCS94354.1 MAG: 50S ribosomal protein L44e [Metallosphaera javensis (ex Sakai et al. 2022)]